MKRKNPLRHCLVIFCFALVVFAVGAIIAGARETLTVQITPPSKSQLNFGESLTLVAEASGGPGGYNYQWYSNDSAIAGETSSTYTFVASVIGNKYNIKCGATDATGAITGEATSPDVYLEVTTKAVTAPPLAQGANSPASSPTQTANTTGGFNLANQWPLVIAAAAVVIIVAAAVAAMQIQRRKPKKQANP